MDKIRQNVLRIVKKYALTLDPFPKQIMTNNR